MKGSMAFNEVLDRLVACEIDKVRQHVDHEVERRQLAEERLEIERKSSRLRELERDAAEIEKLALHDLLDQVRQKLPLDADELRGRVHAAMLVLDPIPF